MGEDNYTFIEEKIKPKKTRVIKENMMRLLKILVSGVIFGGVSAFIFFAVASNLFASIEKEPFTINKATPLPQNDNTPSEKKEITKDSIEKLDIRDYSKIYSVLYDYATSYSDTVVTVAKLTEGTDCFSNPVERMDSFSGLVLRIDRENIYILTEYDGLDVSCNYEVIFINGEHATAGVLGCDKSTGLAVIYAKLDDLGNELLETVRTALFGSSDKLEAGEFVTAIGNPDGHMYSVSFGMITSSPVSKYMFDRKVCLYSTSIQSVSQSGGVVMNASGQVVGIITHRFDSEESGKLSFMGVSELRGLIEQLVNNEKRGSLGVIACDIIEEYKSEIGISNGIYINEVMSKSPAMKAGIAPGDVITEIDGKEINSVNEYAEILAEYKSGDSIKIKIFRSYAHKEKEKMLEILLEDMEDAE